MVFTKNLLGDILSFSELDQSEIALMDIDGERLRVAEVMAHQVADAVQAKPQITAYSDRRKALEGADYCIIMIQVGGYEPSTVIDFEIPKKYGLKQTIADTIGIGGIMRGLRTIPVLLSMLRDMEEVCPDVQILNYSNPMGINTGAMLRTSNIKTVGLCHGIQGTAHQLAKWLDVPYEELEYVAGGINHMAFFVKLAHRGQDLYPKFKKLVDEGADFVKHDRVRLEMMKRLGYYGGESSEHTAEYLTHFIRRDREDLIERFGVPIDEYIRRCISQNEGWEKFSDKLLSGNEPLEVHRSTEYGSLIIHSMETGTPRVIYGNVLNHGLITNLPPRSCVEVPCLVDYNGIQACVFGDLPPQCAGYVRTNINVQELTIEAALQGRRDHIYHAAMLDPHTSAELTLDEIHSMVDELIESHGDYLPDYS